MQEFRLPDDGGDFNVYDDRIEVTGINRTIDRFFLFVGVTAEHRFKIAKEDFPLRRISQPQKNLLIMMDRVSLFNLIQLRHFR